MSLFDYFKSKKRKEESEREAELLMRNIQAEAKHIEKSIAMLDRLILLLESLVNNSANIQLPGLNKHEIEEALKEIVKILEKEKNSYELFNIVGCER